MTLMQRLARASQAPGSVLIVSGFLRLFLGLTFLYAGLQKLTDPGFLDPAASGYVGEQLLGFVRAGSPLSPLITRLAVPNATLVGTVVALAEIWIGILTLAGLLSRLVSAAGLLTSVVYYLTATWAVQPYFLGADIPYAACWLVLLLTGPGAYSLDRYFFGMSARRGDALATAPNPGVPVSRAAFLRALGALAGLLASGGVVGGLARLRAPAERTGSGGSEEAQPLPENSARQIRNPRTGGPAVLVRLPSGEMVAYSAVCTHQGCTVGYDPRRRLLVCPCHGSTFDPARGARVLSGPATRPLENLQMPGVPSIDDRPAAEGLSKPSP
jgi:thiosulfate dehydrogenase [quinone] large subunit